MTTIFLADQPVQLTWEIEKFFRLLSEDKVFPRECANIKAKFLDYWDLIIQEREDPENLGLPGEVEAAGLVLAEAIEKRNQLRELVWRKIAKRKGILGVCAHCGAPIKREHLHDEIPPRLFEVCTSFYGFLGEEKTAEHHNVSMIFLACEQCQDAVYKGAESNRSACTILMNHPWPAVPMVESWARMEKIPPAIWFYEHQRKVRVICLPGPSTTLVYLR